MRNLFDTEYEADEREELKRFLASPVGLKLLRNLYFHTPSSSDKAEHNLAFRAGIAQGWRNAIERIQMLSESEASKQEKDKAVSTTSNLDLLGPLPGEH